MKKPVIAAVAAIGRNRELGKGGKLLWHIPDDLKRFKELTIGHPMIMGRKTFESIIEYLGHSLPERQNIVISRSARYGAANPLLAKAGYNSPDVLVAGSLEEAIEKAKELDGEEIHIGGGAEIYKQAFPIIDKLFLTIIDAEAPAGADSFFPPYEHLFIKKVFEEEREWNGIKYKWVDLERGN